MAGQMLKGIFLGILGLAGTALALSVSGNMRDTRIADVIWKTLRASQLDTPKIYDPGMIAQMPAIAKRYLSRAIAPGTPLQLVVELQMDGVFALNGRDHPVRASQIMAAPHGFVWRTEIGTGLLRFAGSDGYQDGKTSWTRFWMAGVLPLSRMGDTPDHASAAATRMA